MEGAAGRAAGGSGAPGRKGPFRAGLYPLFSPCPAPCPSPFWGALELTACVTRLAQEFENAEGEEYAADFSAQGSPAAAAQNGPDVYVQIGRASCRERVSSPV